MNEKTGRQDEIFHDDDRLSLTDVKPSVLVHTGNIWIV
jgi:hypothetical protein